MHGKTEMNVILKEKQVAEQSVFKLYVLFQYSVGSFLNHC